MAGEIPVGRQGLVSYQLYVVNGVVLDAEVNEGKAVAVRISLSPALGYEFAVSGYVGEYTPDFLEKSENVWSIAGDARATLGPIEIEGEYLSPTGRMSSGLPAPLLGSSALRPLRTQPPVW
jgi:hypothetical protein